ncbi:YggS family pyridoxal phosphate-dependent enzyme [Legionella worsleiensis]|uniref:Pyridoxal phosphate homeostasis protein n=1 Tax=Legionella worsleiensis TaxID=45076 RepID=A0A0W1AIW1_9GAMM|nr:YggS family pyridoxal phosphate-dependent enzyme [Legionella worsleiensis]KTD81306.1 pyridoxal-5'-phosphate dependent enzyme family transporter protein [Legionella worsleiensis]STY30790.1 pyridoxal-5'-phosphate dependent enzyme family [Legionella worsleiensis]
MNISDNINAIRDKITQAEKNGHRQPGSVLLLAVSKQHSVESITEAFNNGICDFGENYFQEAEKKINQLRHLPLCWHFIGPIQSNKTKGIATLFHWVHSVDRLKIAKLLSEHRPKDLPPINVCLQINLAKELTKSGVSGTEAMELADTVRQLPHLNLRGLMTIPPPMSDPQKQYDLFLELNQLMHSINKQLHLEMDTLSMGMSDDLLPAIKAGSTIVRIGRAIFGERQGLSL